MVIIELIHAWHAIGLMAILKYIIMCHLQERIIEKENVGNYDKLVAFL